MTPVDVRRLVPFRPAALAGSAVGGGGACCCCWARCCSPGTIARGLGLLLRVPTRFEGAVVTTEPLIGDVRITYSYPPYTGLPGRVVEGSTGDIVAVKGTEVVLETRLLRRAREALLLLGDAGEVGEKPVELGEGRLRAAFKVEESGSYRVWLSPLLGRPVREARAHRIVAEADEAPRVEIFGPADRLELPTPRPIEVGFSATDDYGLGAGRAGLPGGGRARAAHPAQGRRPPAPAPPRAAPSSSPTSTGRRPGRGWPTGSRPRTTTASRAARPARRARSTSSSPTRARASTSSCCASGRSSTSCSTTWPTAWRRWIPTPTTARAAVGGRTPGRCTGLAAGAWDTASKLVPWLSVHEALESHVAALGRIIDDERRSGSGSKSVLAALSSIADRLARRLREESGAAGQPAGPDRRQPDHPGTPGGSSFDRLLKHEVQTRRGAGDRGPAARRSDRAAAAGGSGRHGQDAGRHLQAAAGPAEPLPGDQGRGPAPPDRAGDPRPAGAHRAAGQQDRRPQGAQRGPQRVAEHARPAARPWTGPASSPTCWRRATPSRCRRPCPSWAAPWATCARCWRATPSRSARTASPQENKAVSEALKQIGELESDERMLAGRQLAPWPRRPSSRRPRPGRPRWTVSWPRRRDKAEKLRRRLSKAPPTSCRRTARTSSSGPRRAPSSCAACWASTSGAKGKKEAERAVSSLRRLRRELDRREQKNPRPSAAAEEFSESMGEARSIAQEIASDLEKLTPKPGEGMSQEQKGRSQGMAQRQRSLAERAEELAREAARNARQGGGPGPGRQRAARDRRADGPGPAGPGRAATRARAAARRARPPTAWPSCATSCGTAAASPTAATAASRCASPGADESKAPREWRQELLEAMRERAPERYGEEVRKYYEEIAK